MGKASGEVGGMDENKSVNRQPLVSVIIPTYNAEKYLDRCLKSIKDQTYKNYEIIVVDNNSRDNTKKIAKKYTKLVFNKGPERSAQRNFGAKKAKGKYVYFVDADFILEKEVISECVNKISEGFDAIVVHNTPDITISWIAKIRKFETDMYKYNLDHSASRFFKKEIFFKINGYNEKITAGEDYDIQNRINKNKYKTGFIKAEALHLGEPKRFFPHMVKYYNYGKDFVNYRDNNEKESKKQLGFFRGVYIKNWKKFIIHPFLGISFIFYHLSKFIFGGIGYLVGRMKR